MATPTLINLPPPPSDPVTPSEMGPGTPNSGTTSLSALSTTAIKDGHKGHAPPHSHHHHTSSSASNSSTNTLDAERADRISRLAGLERVSTVRQTNPGFAPAGTATNPNPTQAPAPIGYFDQTGQPIIGKERSTVGSASATGSAGGRTTWADGSEDADKMSEDDGVSSAGFSDQGNASLVGFGEDASGRQSNFGLAGQGERQGGFSGGFSAPRGPGSPMQGVEKAKMIDGQTYDRDVVDTTTRNPVPADDDEGRGGR